MLLQWSGEFVDISYHFQQGPAVVQVPGYGGDVTFFQWGNENLEAKKVKRNQKKTVQVSTASMKHKRRVVKHLDSSGDEEKWRELDYNLWRITFVNYLINKPF